MHTFPTGAASVLARCVSAEIRSRLGAQRIAQRSLAEGAGFASHNYVSTRLRDEKPFTLDDVELIADFFGQGDEPEVFMKDAVTRHLEAVMDDMYEQRNRAGLVDGVHLNSDGTVTPISVKAMEAGSVGWSGIGENQHEVEMSGPADRPDPAIAADEQDPSIAGEQEQPTEP